MKGLFSKFNGIISFFSLLVVFVSASIIIYKNLFKAQHVPYNVPNEIILDFNNSKSKYPDYEKVIKNLSGIKSDKKYMYLFNNGGSNNDPMVSFRQTPAAKNLFLPPEGFEKIKFSFDTFKRSPQFLVSSNRTQIFKDFNFSKSTKVSKVKGKSICKIVNIGDVSFCLEDSMKLNESYKALLIISKELGTEVLNEIKKEAFPAGIPVTTIDTMILARKIYASLQPAVSDHFNIIRADLDSAKIIDLNNKDFITWEWVITPLKVGESNLVLKLSRIEVPVGDMEKFIPSKIIPIKVYADEKGFGELIGDFMEREWKFLLTGLIGGIGWIIAFRQKKKNDISGSKRRRRFLNTNKV